MAPIASFRDTLINISYISAISIHNRTEEAVRMTKVSN